MDNFRKELEQCKDPIAAWPQTEAMTMRSCLRISDDETRVHFILRSKNSVEPIGGTFCEYACER